ncbi:MAG TPA: glycosyltransferase family 2 protein [Candidatus Binataceae bacterium]|nr:glycosyltransferase family 2 protein [Candidatus Binataceae bacterium]
MQTVSVIVAVLNRASTLQRCIDSVADQTHHALELILFDGGSKDGSREILEANTAKITHWQSGPDRGIPQAWNMALERATGEWICFLGADDRFATSSAIAALLHATRDPDINYVSGQAALISEDGRTRRIIGTRWNWERMKRYQHIAHPGSIHRHDLFERYGNFDERYPIAFDYEFLLRVGRAVRAEFVAQPITLMGNGGQSNTQAWRAFRENRRIHALHPEIGSVGAAFHHAVAATKHFARIASPRLIASARNYL